MECGKPLTTKNDAFVRSFARSQKSTPPMGSRRHALAYASPSNGVLFFLMAKSTLPFLVRTRFFVRDLGSSLPSLAAPHILGRDHVIQVFLL